MHTSLNKLQNIATSCTVTTHKLLQQHQRIFCPCMEPKFSVTQGYRRGKGGFSCKKSPPLTLTNLSMPLSLHALG